MEFGLSFLPDASPKDKDASSYFSEALLLCDQADRAGFYCVKMTEHYIHPYGGYCPNPLVFLSAASVCTKNLHLMTGCILPAFHHPIQIASETAMVDNLSRGRLEVGFARAYLPYEFDAFGIDIDESRARFEQTLLTVQRLWTGESVTQNSDFFRFEQVTTLPRVHQHPHPPIWCAAVNSRQSFSWIGEQGFNLMITPPPGPLTDLLDNLNIYWDSKNDSQYRHIASKIAISLPLLMASTNQRAEQLATNYLTKYLATWADAASCWLYKSSCDYPGYRHIADIIKSNTAVKMMRHRQALVGVSERILEDLFYIQEVLGVDLVLLQIDFGAQPFVIARETLDIFCMEVLPKWRLIAS